jgi:hypothetical protein
VELGHELVKPGPHVMIPLQGIAQLMGVLEH